MLENKFKKLRFFLIVVMCASIPAFSAYLQYNGLAEADFLSSTLNFESVDLENGVWVERQHLLTVCGLDGLPTLFSPEKDIFHQEDDVVSPESVTSERTSILRC